MVTHAFDMNQAVHLAKMWERGAADSGPSEVSLPRRNGTFDACLQNFANGTPPRVPDLAGRRARPLCFDGFAILHSGQTKTPVYAAEVLNKERILAARTQQRTNNFFPDARLPVAERATLEDYRGSGFDRGHNAPSGDQASPEAVAQSFSLANIFPQEPKNNQGPWAQIEQSTRKYVLRAKGDVYVITGSLLLPGACPFTVPNCQIGRGVTVPSHLYKLVYDATTQRAWAHWMPNTQDAQVGRPLRYEQLVALTGIEFLPGIQPRN